MRLLLNNDQTFDLVIPMPIYLGSPQWVVYGLVSSESPDKIVYIGKTKNLFSRFAQHISNARSSPLVYSWVNKTQVKGFVPGFIILQVCLTDGDALLSESILIKKHKPPFNVNGSGNRTLTRLEAYKLTDLKTTKLKFQGPPLPPKQKRKIVKFKQWLAIAAQKARADI